MQVSYLNSREEEEEYKKRQVEITELLIVVEIQTGFLLRWTSLISGRTSNEFLCFFSQQIQFAVIRGTAFIVVIRGWASFPMRSPIMIWIDFIGTWNRSTIVFRKNPLIIKLTSSIHPHAIVHIFIIDETIMIIIFIRQSIIVILFLVVTD